MSQFSEKNFGLVIAYILPGFTVVWGLSFVSPTVASWLNASQQAAPTVAGLLLLTVASLASGLVVSVIRWAVVDTIHHRTGVPAPDWEFANLQDRLSGFLAIVENHYRYYQCYANMFVATPMAGQRIWPQTLVAMRRLPASCWRCCAWRRFCSSVRVTRCRNTTPGQNVCSACPVVLTKGKG